jgi:hypothetical protein
MIGDMALNFPNPSRSYDESKHCIRFWAYDQSLEIPFFVDEEALCSIDPSATRSEASFLSAFDRHRDRVLKAATGSIRVRAEGRICCRLRISLSAAVFVDGKTIGAGSSKVCADLAAL